MPENSPDLVIAQAVDLDITSAVSVEAVPVYEPGREPERKIYDQVVVGIESSLSRNDFSILFFDIEAIRRIRDPLLWRSLIDIALDAHNYTALNVILIRNSKNLGRLQLSENVIYRAAYAALPSSNIMNFFNIWLDYNAKAVIKQERLWVKLVVSSFSLRNQEALVHILSGWPLEIEKPEIIYELLLSSVADEYKYYNEQVAILAEDPPEENPGFYRFAVSLFYDGSNHAKAKRDIAKLVSWVGTCISILARYGIEPTEGQKNMVRDAEPGKYPEKIVEKISGYAIRVVNS